MPIDKKNLFSKLKNLSPRNKIIFGSISGLIVIILILSLVLISGGARKNANADNTAFDFGDCLKNNTKPGEDSHNANDICITLQAEYNKAHDISTNTQTTVDPLSMNNGTFSFSDCLRDNTKPAEDSNSANDICVKLQDQYNASHNISTPKPTAFSGPNLGDATSTDPMQKGLALSAGQCTGTGTVQLTHAPMDTKDVETIQPMGYMIGGHVTPVDHEYYYQKNFNAPKDTYPVYATADGTIVGVQHVGNAWLVVLSHSCTFFTQYNLMTSFDASLVAQLPNGWGPNSNGGVKIPVKAGQLIGHVGGQSLDFCVWNTETQLKGYVVPLAYNNREPWKIVTDQPLKYFSDSVKTDILSRYVRTAEPRDGKIDYDVDGQAIGNWFLENTNGYAGGEKGDGSTKEYLGHLSLTYDYVDPTAKTFSIGNYQGDAAQFAVIGGVDWTAITKNSGVVKVELGERQYKTSDGNIWAGKFAKNIKMSAGPSKATALIQMTTDRTMKVEVFSGKTPTQVTGFTTAAKTYTRGQDAHMIISNTAH